MGIRIRKVMGYGLTDVETSDQEITDTRINPESPLLRCETSLKEYLKYLKGKECFEARMEESVIHDGSVTERDLHSVLTWDPEYGMPNVLVITPLGYRREWIRYDDSLDYEEHFLVKDATTEPSVKEIPTGIYPYSGYMDRVTGERTDNIVYTWRKLLEMGAKVSVVKTFSRSLGYESTEQAHDRIVPVVPLDVRHLAEFGSLFRDPGTWKRLRPMIYTFLA